MNICSVAVVVEYSRILSFGVLKYVIICWCKGCDGCCVLCLYWQAWRSR